MFLYGPRRVEYATRHTLQDDSCASAVPGHTATARATKVVNSRVAWRAC